MEDSYERAIRLLNSRKASPKPQLKDMRGSDDMVDWLRLLGYSKEQLKGLNVVHVAGTKGKGSTCAFIEVFLRVHGRVTGYPRKTGLYTSPHIKSVRERIRLNGQPISKELFTTTFFEVWEKLPTCATTALDIPRYLQLLALLSAHVFIKEGIDVAIYETHSGGEYDATNIFDEPVATGITPIGMEHVCLLGPTIGDISWHKAGIFKFQRPAFSAPQVLACAEVLQRRAEDKQSPLQFTDVDHTIPSFLQPDALRMNCSLALALVASFLQEKAPRQHNLLVDRDRAIGQYCWPGRYQCIVDTSCQWFLDGAHSEYTMPLTVDWFAKTSLMMRRDSSRQVLIFSHIKREKGIKVLECMYRSFQRNGIQVPCVIFTTYDQGESECLSIERNFQRRISWETLSAYADAWKQLDPGATTSLKATIESSLALAKDFIGLYGGIQVLVTGSLHLVSGALCLLQQS